MPAPRASGPLLTNFGGCARLWYDGQEIDSNGGLRLPSTLQAAKRQEAERILLQNPVCTIQSCSALIMAFMVMSNYNDLSPRFRSSNLVDVVTRGPVTDNLEPDTKHVRHCQ